MSMQTAMMRRELREAGQAIAAGTKVPPKKEPERDALVIVKKGK